MFGIEEDFQQLMEQFYGPLGEKQMTEIEEIKEQIKVLEKKVSFLEELEKTKSPVEECYKDWWGEYPTDTFNSDDVDDSRWMGFQAGYNAAYEEKVKETAQERGERLHKDVERVVKENMKWFEEHPDKDPVDYVKPQTPKTLTDLIHRWWEDVFTTHSDWDMETSIEDLVDQIEMWLPKEHDTNSYKWNQCIRMIREKLR